MRRRNPDGGAARPRISVLTSSDATVASTTDRAPCRSGAAQLQVGAGECAVAARRQQELEHLPGRTVDGDPRLHVRAERGQQPVAIQRLQRLRFVAVNRSACRRRPRGPAPGPGNARENRRQAHWPPVASRNGAIPRSTWNSGCPEPRPASAPIHRRRSHAAPAGIQAGMTELDRSLRLRYARSANQAGPDQTGRRGDPIAVAGCGHRHFPARNDCRAGTAGSIARRDTVHQNPLTCSRACTKKGRSPRAPP